MDHHTALLADWKTLCGQLEMAQQGTLTVLYRQTSFGTFGGGDALSCNILAHNCCTSGRDNCDRSTGDGSGGKSGPPGSTTAPGGNTVPGGIGGTGIPPGSTTVPGGNATPGGVEDREHRDGRGSGEDHVRHTATLTPTDGHCHP